MSNWREMLREAKDLFDEGLIDAQEYSEMKQEALALKRSQSTSSGTTGTGHSPARPPRHDSLIGTSGFDTTGFRTGMGSTGGGLSIEDEFSQKTQFQAVGQNIGSYKVLGEIGQGGMGTVYRVRHSVEAFAQQTGDVVIKLMNPQFAQDPTFRQRFITEAATGRSIQHPNVVRIHDVIFEEHKNVLAIVMDLVEGRPLENIIPSGGMPMEQALPIITQLSEALDHIHEMGIIHRDLKPENIIVSPSGKPVILDMGIAKNTDNNVNMTRTNTPMGTPLYMAPEQVDAKNVTSAADRYAFGLIVYQMLSGKLPWDSGSGLGMITAYKMMGNLNLLKDVANVSETVSDAVMALLRTQAVDRTMNCSVFCASLLNTGPKPLDVVEFGSGAGKHEMVLIPKGDFMMGALENDEDARGNEKLRHKVTLTQDFFMGKYPVTQTLWESVMGSNPSSFKGPNRPVESVSWLDCILFCNKLSEIEGFQPVYQGLGDYQIGQYFDDEDESWGDDDEYSWLRGSKTAHEIAKMIIFNTEADGYRLPTEAEWEYSARANQSYKYSGSNKLDEVAWHGLISAEGVNLVDQDLPWYIGGTQRTFSADYLSKFHQIAMNLVGRQDLPRHLRFEDFENLALFDKHLVASHIAFYGFGSTHAVGQKSPNGFGLYDMSGNVDEWCWDWEEEYSTDNQLDPMGAYNSYDRIQRGGSWLMSARAIKRSHRRNPAFRVRVSCRSGGCASRGTYTVGFRLARYAN